MKELVSIIIPTYKRNENLEKAIDSVLKQTYDNIEIIVVDDNDSETTYREKNEILMNRYKKNSKVIYIKHEKNKNGAAARNTGIKQANGSYIGFLDDDDEFMPTKIEEQVSFLEKNIEYNCVGCQIYRGQRIEKQKINEETLLEDILSLKISPITSMLLFREKAIKDINGFNENYRRHQDVEMLARYLQKNRFGYIEKPLIKMGINNGENQLNGEKLKELKEQFLKDFMPAIDDLENKRKGSKKRILCSHYVAMTINFLKNRNKDLLKEITKKAFKSYPITYTVNLIKSILYRSIIHLRWR